VKPALTRRRPPSRASKRTPHRDFKTFHHQQAVPSSKVVGPASRNDRQALTPPRHLSHLKRFFNGWQGGADTNPFSYSTPSTLTFPKGCWIATARRSRPVDHRAGAT
jgi:hypothetical protein